MTIRFPEDEVRPMGRGAAGVSGIEVEEDDQVIARRRRSQEGAPILTVTERGYGKRTPLEEYRLQGRGGKGIIDIKTAGRNGTVVGMVQVREGDDILVVTTKGKMIRIHADEVSSPGPQHDGRAHHRSRRRRPRGLDRARRGRDRRPRRNPLGRPCWTSS